jgi:hypothetical protein
MQGGTIKESTVIKKFVNPLLEVTAHDTNLGKKHVDEPIQEPAEDLVTYEDRDIQVTNS